MLSVFMACLRSMGPACFQTTTEKCRCRKCTESQRHHGKILEDTHPCWVRHYLVSRFCSPFLIIKAPCFCLTFWHNVTDSPRKSWTLGGAVTAEAVLSASIVPLWLALAFLPGPQGSVLTVCFALCYVLFPTSKALALNSLSKPNRGRRDAPR